MMVKGNDSYEFRDLNASLENFKRVKLSFLNINAWFEKGFFSKFINGKIVILPLYC